MPGEKLTVERPRAMASWIDSVTTSVITLYFHQSGSKPE